MSEAAAQVQHTTAQEDLSAPKSLLEQAISVTNQTTPDRVKELLDVLTTEALEGAVTWDKNLTKTIDQAIKLIDKKLSDQLSKVMQAPEFTKLEGSWRGMSYLIKNGQVGGDVKVRILNVKKNDLLNDFNKVLDFDQSQLFKKLYENEFGTPGGEPYGLLIGDYEFTNHPNDLNFLDNISHAAAAAFCPFVGAANADLIGLSSWDQLSKPTDLKKIFDTPEYAQWRGLRESEDSRFVTLAMPKVLARVPYGEKTKPVEAFKYEEAPTHSDGKPKALPHDKYCWMNASFVMGAQISNAFAEHGWCTAIRGAENGGKVTGLPVHVFTTDDGDVDFKCPTEIGITDRREAELSKLGFLPLCHYKNTDYAVFFGAQTIQKPKIYEDDDATSNAAISARLPYIMATSRIAHFLKIMARDKIGSFMEVNDVEKWLNDWILSYINSNENAGPILKARYPLAEAKIKVEEVPGQPGAYHAIAWLRPWLQLEELTTSLRLVAKIPTT